MQLQLSALRQLFFLCSCACPLFPGFFFNMPLQLSNFWELFVIRSCSAGAFQNYFCISCWGRVIRSSRCVPYCVEKTCAVRPVFARAAGQLGAADARTCSKGNEPNASPGTHSEAPQ